MKNIIVYLSVGLLGLSLGNCTGEFEEMNTNPNSPADVPAATLLPKVIIETAKIQDMRTAGLYVRFFAQNSYIVEDRFRFPDNDLLTLWEGNYIRILENSRIIREKSTGYENKNMVAIAEIISVNAFHTLTDVYGEIPYSEALRSKEGITNPAYDKQQDIYPDLLVRLEKANAMLNGNNGKIEGDILFDGDLYKWKTYCNSLTMRIAMRMSNIEPDAARLVIEKITADNITYPVISSNNDNIRLKWQGVAPYREPWAQEYISGIDGSNHAVSETMMTYLIGYKDPRLTAYARPTKYNGAYIGAVNGPAVGDEQERDKVSRIGTFYTSDEAGYTKLFTYSEICFILAEAAERGWNVGVSAKEAYASGIKASLEYNRVSDAEIAQFLESEKIAYQSGNKSVNLYNIAYQKWVSLYLQGLQGWAEARRTDIPLLTPGAGTLYPGKHNRAPFRAVWPGTEDMYNNKNYKQAKQNAGITEESDQLWGKQLWWDTRKEVY